MFDAGITSVEELKKNQDSLTPYQKIGLKHFEDFELRIPRDEIGEIEIKAKKVNFVFLPCTYFGLFIM